MDREILKYIDKSLEAGQNAALIIIEEQEGSAPGEVGTLMALAADGTSAGTCGGGTLEKVLTARVLEGMAKAENFRFRYDLAGDLGIVCGGATAGYVRYFSQGPRLVLFGAGHCSQALARLMKNLRFSLTVVDSREEYADHEAFRGAKFLKLSPAEAVKELSFGPDLYLVAANWGHHLDHETYRACLGKEYAFLGGLGSSKKSREIREKLRQEGFDQDEIDSLHLPIGIDLADGTPEEIAISILAELLLVKNGRELKFKRENISSGKAPVSRDPA